MRIISTVIAGTGFVSFLLGFEYGFLACGDYPDNICTGLLIAGMALIGLGALLEPRKKTPARKKQAHKRVA